MMLLGIDVGTTHCKAGLFRQDGSVLAVASRTTDTRRAAAGYYYYEPESLWQTVLSAVAEVLQSQPGQTAAVGIASMAETGLLVDRETGEPRSIMIPWFDTSAAPQAAGLELQEAQARLERFTRTGIRPTFKCSLAKLLWLREQYGDAVIENACWLSVSDYIAYRLTGRMATAYSLAGRTYAFRLDRLEWDAEWLARFGLNPGHFAEPLPSGALLGGTLPGLESSGLPAGTPVAIGGHDHLCAAFAVQALLQAERAEKARSPVSTGQVFDSMGTAETLLGVLPERRPGKVLGEPEFQSGLSYGAYVWPGTYYWMGGLSTSGGSVEWLRSILGEEQLSYAQMDDLLAGAMESRPTGILYFPYLSGSGSPHTGSEVRGALIGLDKAHGRGDLLLAALEGTAYEVEFMRRAGEQALGIRIERVAAAGGGTRNRRWMQVKADVSGCQIEATQVHEATTLGAALLAGIGCGAYAGWQEAFIALKRPVVETYWPDAARHASYRRLYDEGFAPLQQPLRAYFTQRQV